MAEGNQDFAPMIVDTTLYKHFKAEVLHKLRNTHIFVLIEYGCHSEFKCIYRANKKSL